MTPPRAAASFRAVTPMGSLPWVVSTLIFSALPAGSFAAGSVS